MVSGGKGCTSFVKLAWRPDPDPDTPKSGKFVAARTRGAL
jgi:hypothetical protein